MKNDPERISYRLSRQPSVYFGSTIYIPPFPKYLKYELVLTYWMLGKRIAREMWVAFTK
jgi:hypothetical protein